MDHRDHGGMTYPTPSEAIRTAERLTRLETTAEHLKALWRAMEGRVEGHDRRMDGIEQRQAEDRGSTRALEMAAQHRLALRSDAIKGAGLVLTFLLVAGAVIGWIPWDVAKATVASVLGK